ncbi:MAG: hypothetical protein AAF517_25275 [Planctomycetota bacterium]
MIHSRQFVLITLGLTLCFVTTLAEDHQHHGADSSEDKAKKTVKPPRIFLDKSPRIVQYQLKRLSNERLLLVERRSDHKKYAPVHVAILSRAGMPRVHREEALNALVSIRKSSRAEELLGALSSLKQKGRQRERTVAQLATILLAEPQTALATAASAFESAVASSDPSSRSIGFAGLIAGGGSEKAWTLAEKSFETKYDWLTAIPRLPDPATRDSLRAAIVKLCGSGEVVKVRRAAIAALKSIEAETAATFELLVELVSEPELRSTAVGTLLTVPAKERGAAASRKLLDLLVNASENTAAADRTSDEFLNGLQLIDQSLVSVDAA